MVANILEQTWASDVRVTQTTVIGIPFIILSYYNYHVINCYCSYYWYNTDQMDLESGKKLLVRCHYWTYWCHYFYYLLFCLCYRHWIITIKRELRQHNSLHQKSVIFHIDATIFTILYTNFFEWMNLIKILTNDIQQL